MNSRKSQIGLREFLVTLVVAGILAIVGVMVFSKVSSTTENIFDKDEDWTINESVTIVMMDDSENSTLLTYDDLVPGNVVVANTTNHAQTLVEAVDFTLIDATGNFTFLHDLYNNTATYVSYQHYEDSDAMLSKDTIEDTVLDSFELAVIALIILAAVVILGTLFMLGGK